jgi:phosphoribosylglycinamide formyltransferase-1
MEERPRVAILISGRGSNMEALLRAERGGVLAGRCQVALVFSNKPEAPGLEIARSFGVPTLCLESLGQEREAYDAQLLARLEPYALDWLVLAGYLRILSSAVIQRYLGRIVNIHPADTALHKGLHGYRWAFEHRLLATKITVHLVDEGLDTGRILEQREVDLRGAQSEEEVERRGLAVEHQLYPEALARLFGGQGVGAVRS